MPGERAAAAKRFDRFVDAQRRQLPCSWGGLRVSMSDQAVQAGGWVFLVPFKDGRTAKSRLRLPRVLREELAAAMAHDTVERVLQVPSFDSVLVVCERVEDVTGLARVPRVRVLVDDRARGLNGALRWGEEPARTGYPGAFLAVFPADLPTLRPAELTAVSAECARRPRTVVADRSGAGTSLLTAARGVPLSPKFGSDSLALHVSSGATPLNLPRHSALRHDVDTLSDCSELWRLALRSRTARALNRAHLGVGAGS